MFQQNQYKISDQLKKFASERGIAFQDVRRYYAMERFLYRLSISKYANHFFLKGALMFKIWDSRVHRYTQDIDFLARGISNTHANLAQVVKEICNIDHVGTYQISQIDGTTFSWGSRTEISVIKEGNDYYGSRIDNLEATIEGKLQYLQLDIGFDDVITNPATFHYPTMVNELHQFRPKLTGYTPELSFAEKLVTMANKGEGNTRVKDFYDLFMLCDQNPLLDPRKLKEEIRRVFKNRGITPAYPEVLKTRFVYSKDKAALDRAWNNLMRKIGVSVRLDDVLRNLEHFLRRNNLIG